MPSGGGIRTAFRVFSGGGGGDLLTRREWLASGSAGTLLAQERPPNIVLLMTDQQTISALSAAGNPHVRTPNLDRLAREGMRFENSWCASPVCSPARSSLITGCYPTTSGVVYNGNLLNPDVPTAGEIFQAAGYETAWAGKWHFPAPFPGAECRAASRPAGQRSGL